jgi:uncharacterized protein (TIGR02118 family)
MTVQEFQDYWCDQHAPLAAKLPGLRRYILCPTIPSEYEREQQPDFDGVSEMSFEDVAAFERAKQSPEYKAVAADLANFVGERTELLENEVELISAYPTPEERKTMVKYIAMLFLKDGVPIQEFQHHWKDVHGPINVGNSKIMKRYVQSHILPEMFDGPNPPRYGGLPEAWYESLDVIGILRAIPMPCATRTGPTFAAVSTRS